MTMKSALFLLITFFSLNCFSQTNITDENGLKQGKWQKTYPNGNLIYEGSFKDDKPVGNWTRYYEGGTIKAKFQYRQDSDSATAVLFNPFGRKMAEGIYVNEKRTGNWRFYSDNRLISEEMYDNGIKHGLSKTFYPTGEILEEIEWKDGQQNGKYSV